MKITAEHARVAVPVVRRALKEAGLPAWVKAAVAALGKYLPTILMLIAQIVPLVAASPAGPPRAGDESDLDPATRRALQAYRDGEIGD